MGFSRALQKVEGGGCIAIFERIRLITWLILALQYDPKGPVMLELVEHCKNQHGELRIDARPLGASGKWKE